MRIQELVDEVQKDSNGTLVRSQCMAIAKAIAKAVQATEAKDYNLAHDAVVTLDTDADNITK